MSIQNSLVDFQHFWSNTSKIKPQEPKVHEPKVKKSNQQSSENIFYLGMFWLSTKFFFISAWLYFYHFSEIPLLCRFTGLLRWDSWHYREQAISRQTTERSIFFPDHSDTGHQATPPRAALVPLLCGTESWSITTNNSAVRYTSCLLLQNYTATTNYTIQPAPELPFRFT